MASTRIQINMLENTDELIKPSPSTSSLVNIIITHHYYHSPNPVTQ